MGVIGISKEKIIERRLSQRISQQLQLTIRSHANSLEIHHATIENISIGGMQISIPADSAKLQIHDTCSFIFDIPPLGKSYVLGEILYQRDWTGANQPPVIHYGVKFIKLPMKIWHHIKQCCRDEAELPMKKTAVAEEIQQAVPAKDSLTTQTFGLIQVEIRPENSPEIKATVRDINYAGMKLQLSQAILPNIHLFIKISFLEQVVTVTGICTGSLEISENPGSSLVNICFTELNQMQFDTLQSLMMKLAAHMADSINKSL